MEEIVKTCKIHGELKIEQVYRNNDKNLKSGFCYKCKQCCYDNARKRPCPTHGELRPEERVESGQCRVCSFENLKRANEKRNNNREWWNERERKRRATDPEKWHEECKKKYQRELDKYGIDGLNEQKTAQRFKLTIEQLRQMFIDYDNKCAICRKEETRWATIKGGENKRAKLCIDHDHVTGKIRGLLCHDCNTSIGKMKDDINILQSAIDYLKKHEE